MTASFPAEVSPRPVLLTDTPIDAGCSSCGTQQTVTLDSRFGRRCPAHPPWLSLAEQGRAAAAFDCLRWWLSGEAVRRFGGAV